MQLFAVSNIELNKLCRMFLELDWDRRGFITFDEFLSLPAFAHCPFQPELARVLDTDPRHRMNFMVCHLNSFLLFG
jgi:Ca2+-binding EF-hand superfamily protein